MAVSSTVEEQDGRTWVKMCMSVFVTLVLSVAVDGIRFDAVRSGDKVTLSCGQHNRSCESIDWLFTGKSYSSVLLARKGQVSQQYVKEYGQMSLTSDCSLEIMKISKELAGQFNCRWKSTLQDLASILLSVVSMTGAENYELVCSLTSQDGCRSVRWLYNGKPYLKTEYEYRWKHTIRMCQKCKEQQRKELFSCEVSNKCTGDGQVFPLTHQDATTLPPPPPPPTTLPPITKTKTATKMTTRQSVATGSMGNTGWWRHLAAVLVTVVLICILVDSILCKGAKGKKKLQEENTVELEAGVFSPSASYTNKGAKVKVTHGGEAPTSVGAADGSNFYCNFSKSDG